MITARPTVWPARLVPAPRGSIGTRRRAQTATAAATSAASRGKTTASGSMLYMLASVEKRWRVYASSRTSPAIAERSSIASSLIGMSSGGAEKSPCPGVHGDVAHRMTPASRIAAMSSAEYPSSWSTSSVCSPSVGGGRRTVVV